MITPVIIIVDDEKDILSKLLMRKGLSVENLAKKSFIESNSALSVFFTQAGQRIRSLPNQ